MSHYNNIRNVYKDKCYVKDIYIYIYMAKCFPNVHMYKYVYVCNMYIDTYIFIFGKHLSFHLYGLNSRSLIVVQSNIYIYSYSFS